MSKNKKSLVGWTFPGWDLFISKLSDKVSNSTIQAKRKNVRYWNGKKFVTPRKPVKVRITMEEI